MSSYLMPAARKLISLPGTGIAPMSGTVGGDSGGLVSSGASGLSIGGQSVVGPSGGGALLPSGGGPTTNADGTVSTGVGSLSGTFMDPNVSVAQASAPDPSTLAGSNAAYSSAIKQAQALGTTPVNLTSPALAAANNAQSSLAKTLTAQANGGGTSAADIQQQQGIANSILANQAAAATAGNSTNPFLLARQLATQQAATNQAGVGQASLQRAQETQAAQQALGGVLQNQAGNALTASTNAAQLQQGYAQAGLSAQLAGAQGIGSNEQSVLGAQTTTNNNNAALTDAQIRGETTGGDSVGTGLGKAAGGLLSGLASAFL